MTNTSFTERAVTYQHLLYVHSPGHYLLREIQEIYDFSVLLKIADNPVVLTGTKCSCQADELPYHCWRRVRRLAEIEFLPGFALKLAQKLWSSESYFIWKEVLAANEMLLKHLTISHAFSEATVRIII